MTDPTPEFAEALRARRKHLGLTMQQAADRIGVTLSSVHRAETAYRSPTLRTAARYAAGLDTTVADLLSGTSWRRCGCLTCRGLRKAAGL